MTTIKTQKRVQSPEAIEPTSSNRLLRLSSIIGPNGLIPVSKSTWWNKVRSGEFPQPVKISTRITCWREDDILKLAGRGSK